MKYDHVHENEILLLYRYISGAGNWPVCIEKSIVHEQTQTNVRWQTATQAEPIGYKHPVWWYGRGRKISHKHQSRAVRHSKLLVSQLGNSPIRSAEWRETLPFYAVHLIQQAICVKLSYSDNSPIKPTISLLRLKKQKTRMSNDTRSLPEMTQSWFK